MLVPATLNAKQVRLLVKTFILLNVLFLLGTLIINNPPVHLNRYLWIFFEQFDLGSENTVAAWYSSMLLLCCAVMSLVCFMVDRNSFWKYGWLVYAGCFATLSFDEMGSIHEYIGDYAAFKSAGKTISSDENSGWSIFYILVAIVSAAMLMFSFIRLKKVRGALLFFVLGIALYLTNPLQEMYEMQNYASGHRPVYLLLVEEGSEIFGSLFFLLATSVYAAGRSGGEISITLNVTRRSLVIYTFLFLIVLALALTLLTYMFGYVQGQNQVGVPKSWVVSAMAFLVFLYCFYRYVNGNDRRFYFITSAVILLVSVYFGCDRWTHLLPSSKYTVEAGFLFLSLTWLVLLKRTIKSRKLIPVLGTNSYADVI